MRDDELQAVFGPEGWRELPDEIYRRYLYIPSEIKVEEHHVAVYEGLSSKTKVKAKHPAYLFRNSLASASMVSAVIDKKYVNAVRGKLFLQLHGNKFFHCTVSRFFTAW